jgi:glycosyltransferase involved in cell wall biosynthesis
MLYYMKMLLLLKGENDYMDITDGNPFFTIIVAVLNDKVSLERCIESVNSQTYPYKEVIIMDGGSEDGTVEILQNNDDMITYWESNPDHGIYHAWNKALDHARGDWICFVGADDYLYNIRTLENIVPHLIRAITSGIKLVYGQVVQVNETRQPVRVLGKPWGKISWQIRYGMPLHLPHPGMMHHQSLFQEHGRFDQTFKIAGDYEFLLRELKNNKKKALYTGFITMISQIGGISNSNQLATLEEARKAKLRNNLPGFSWFSMAVYIRAVIRRYLNLRSGIHSSHAE